MWLKEIKDTQSLLAKLIYERQELHKREHV